MDMLVNIFFYSVLGIFGLAVVLCLGSLVVAVVSLLASIVLPLAVLLGAGFIGCKIVEGC